MRTRGIRTSGSCLIALVAVCCFTASGASAATYKVCVKAAAKNTGHYPSKECASTSKVETGGKWELAAPSGQTFTTKSKQVQLQIPPEGVVQCKKSMGSGTVVSENESTLVLTMEDCTGGGRECHSPGASSGIVKTELDGTLDEVGPSEVEQLETGTGPEGTAVEVLCEGLPPVRFRGTAGGRIGLVNAEPKANTLNFSSSFEFTSVQEMEYEFEGARRPARIHILGFKTKGLAGVYAG